MPHRIFPGDRWSNRLTSLNFAASTVAVRVPRRARRAIVRLVCGLALGWSAAVVAFAAVIPWMDLPEITARAELVVLGTVESAESGWSDDGRIIVTRTTFSVERVLKGGPRVRVVVETAGGMVGDLAMVASGAPVFRAGERVLLFLEPSGGPQAGAAGGAGAGRHGVVGWNLGRMTVRRDPGTGRDLVEDRSAGTLYLDRAGKPIGPARSGKGPAELQQFLKEIERLVAGGSTGPVR
jgi:hypothetical protein